MALVHDPTQVQLFLDLVGHEGPLLIYQAARTKYCKTLAKANVCFNRRLIRTTSTFLHTLQTMVCEPDIPIEAVATYCSVNPRDLYAAGAATVQAATSAVLTHRTFDTVAVLDKTFLSEAQKHQHRRFIVVDLDCKDYFAEVSADLASHHITPKFIIETRGGYHIVIDKEQVTGGAGKFVYTQLAKRTFVNADGQTKSLVDVLSNPFSPIPGTVQGGFPVRIL
jgi:hypothetical protein